MFSLRSKNNDTKLDRLERSLAALETTSVVEQLSESGENSIGRYGLNLLYTPPTPLVDFVFVHGLGGGSRKTWSRPDNLFSYWPKEWLPRDSEFKNVRVHSFGYDSDWVERKGSILSLVDFGKALQNEITNSPYISKDKETRLVFIGHSMGGLVIKQMYILARRDPSTKSLVDRVYGMVFLATPHRGADMATVLSNILKVSMAHGSKTFVSELERNSVLISSMNDEFRHYSSDLELVSFYETIKTQLGFLSSLIVHKDSATMGYPNEQSALLNATHRSICKFDSPLDPNYITVRNVLAAMARKAVQQVTSSKRDQRRHELIELQDYLSVSGIPDDDLATLEDAKLDGSCHWFTSKVRYISWRDSHPGAGSHYWLNAQQATGKSFLAAHVIKDLEAINKDCSYYFFKHADQTKVSVSGCLRSLAYQMAISNPAISRCLLELKHENVAYDKGNDLAVWRKIFLGGILGVPSSNPHYWVIDGLDECSSPNSIVLLLTKIDNNFPLRVFMTSRPIPEIVRDVSRLGKSVEGDVMTVEDTRNDIEQYLKVHIENSPMRDESSRRFLIETILEKASGSFLWVALVLKEMRSAFTKLEVQRILEEVPSGMDPLYERALALISRTSRSKNLVKAVLRWSICALRPLSLKELEHAILLDTQEKVLDLEAFITSSCWQFIRVSAGGNVSLLHETVRVFLLRGDLQSEFTINEREGHDRLAEICLQYLCSDEMTPPKTPRLMDQYRSKIPSRSAMVNYACEHFTSHLRRSQIKNPTRFKELCNLLTGNILSWIEHVSRASNLQQLMQTAKDLKELRQVGTIQASISSEDLALICSWETDFVRLVSSFGKKLIEFPWAIFWLIPPFCPRLTAIAAQSKRKFGGLVVRQNAHTWNDRISCIQYRDLYTKSLACANGTFAVGFSNKTIGLYSSSTFQELQVLKVAQTPKLLAYSDSGKLLASTSSRFLTVFNLDTRQQLWQVRLLGDCLSIQLADQDKTVWSVAKTGIQISFSVTDGSKLSFAMLKDHPNEIPVPGFPRVFMAVSFAPELQVLAAIERNRPIGLYDMNEGTLLGFCDTRDAGYEREEYPVPLIRDILFRPNQEPTLLAGLYADQRLVLFDPYQMTIANTVEVDGNILASSPDGYSLAIGNHNGTIQIYEFESLTLIYKIATIHLALQSLAFSGDGRRFVDIRGKQCNVWEPAILVRENIGTRDRVFGTIAANPTVVGTTSFHNDPEITVMTFDKTKEYVICGKNNGDVVLFSISTGQELQVFYHHTDGSAIRMLLCDWTLDLLVSVGLRNLMMVWVIIKDGDVWSVEGPLLDIQLPGVNIQECRLDSINHCLSIHTNLATELYSIKDKCLVASIPADKLSGRWINHPRDPSRLIRISGTTAHIYNWTDLSTPYASINLDFNADFRLAAKYITSSSDGSKLFVFFTDLARHQNQNQNQSHFMILPISFFEEPFADAIQTSQVLDVMLLNIERVVGTVGDRLLFLDRSLWVCSIDMEIYSGQYYRHFFIPEDWMNVNRKMILKVNSKGDIVLVKKSEVITIKHGLDLKEVISVKAIHGSDAT